MRSVWKDLTRWTRRENTFKERNLKGGGPVSHYWRGEKAERKGGGGFWGIQKTVNSLFLFGHERIGITAWCGMDAFSLMIVCKVEYSASDILL